MTRYTTYVLIIPVKILVFFIAMVGIGENKTDVKMSWTPGSSSVVRQHHFSSFQPDRLLRGETKLRRKLTSFLPTAVIWQPQLQHHFCRFSGGEIRIRFKIFKRFKRLVSQGNTGRDNFAPALMEWQQVNFSDEVSR